MHSNTHNGIQLCWKYFQPDVSTKRLKYLIQEYKTFKNWEGGNPFKGIIEDSIYEKIEKNPSLWISHSLEEQIINYISQSFDIESILYNSGILELEKNISKILIANEEGNIQYTFLEILTNLPILFGNSIRYCYLCDLVINNEDARFHLMNSQGIYDKWYDIIYVKGFLDSVGKTLGLDNFKVSLTETKLYGIHINHKHLGDKIQFGAKQNTFQLVWKGNPIFYSNYTQDSNKRNQIILLSKDGEVSKELEIHEITGLINKSKELALENRDLEAAVEVLKSFKLELESKQNLIAKDLKLAKNIQQGLIPQYIPDWNGIEFGVYFKPMQEVSGDYFDYFLDNNKIGVILCDVSGHGIPAAFITALSKMLFLTYKSNQPRKIFKKVNRELLKLLQTQGYTTCVYLMLSSNYKLIYSIAGHPRPIYLNYNEGTVGILEGEGTFLGMFPDADDLFEDREMELQPGDKIFVYTDGLIEARNEDGEQYGEKRLKKMIIETKDLTIQESIQHISQDFIKFTMGTDPTDDVTLLGLQLNPKIHEFNEKFIIAKKLYDEKRYSEAKKIFMELRSLIPRDIKVLLYLAKSLAREERYEEAIQIIKNNKQLDLNIFEIHNILGYCYYMMGDYIASVKEYKNAMNIEDNHPSIYKNLLHIYKKLNRMDEFNELDQKFKKNFKNFNLKKET